MGKPVMCQQQRSTTLYGERDVLLLNAMCSCWLSIAIYYTMEPREVYTAFIFSIHLLSLYV